MSEQAVWRIAEPADGIGLFAEADGVWLRGEGLDLNNAAVVRGCTPRSRLGQLLPALIQQLADLGVATVEGEAACIPYREFVTLEAREIDAFQDIVPWAPYTTELKSTGWLGGTTFGYRYRFYLGTQVVSLTRLGCFVRRGNAIARLDAQTFALVEALDAFNGLPPEERAGTQAFIRFAEVKGLAEGVGVQLDRLIAEERVLIPPRIGLDLLIEDGGRITFVPKVEGVEPSAFQNAFLAQDDIDEVYAVPDEHGARARVVLNETQREVLRRMQRVRHVSGVELATVLRNPHAVFDGVAGDVDIDLESFGPRVRGIGEFPFAAQPYLRRGTGIFDGEEALGAGPSPADPVSAGIQCSYVDGRTEDIVFKSPEEVATLHKEVQRAWKSGEGTVVFRGKSIVIDEPFRKAIEELTTELNPRPAPTDDMARPRPGRRFLLIYTNENEIEYEEQPETVAAGAAIVPRSLAQTVSLKEHQLRGLAWMQRCFLTGRRGCLLADDMGMGKTLQILAFLAWVIEQGELSEQREASDLPPWDPILIVAPLVLIENETWVNEMRQFFAADGAVFRPYTFLRGAELQRMRREGVVGRETELGASALDLDRLRQYRVILTNYETVTNYQHSFARMKSHWSIVVTDEAQEYKVPNTKISHALKSLAPRFRIAATGTPVETRLLDVWNIFDFLQPGPLLGSAAEFARQYERGASNQDAGSDALAALRTRLRFGTPDAFVLRREKTELKDLPHKHEHDLHSDLSPEQRRWHIELVQQVRRGDGGRHPLEVIHHLLRLYQHPALVPRYEPTSARDAVARCPKLAVVLEQLRAIRVLGEKTLIFTRSLDMQHLLSLVVGGEFGLEVDIVNGAASRTERKGRRSRREMVKRFRESPGFNVIILSPDVAGLGLTLVEANHVIHYGRWWNPAKESQSTDRAYRIGQTRDVHVYYPIARDPLRQFETFDEKLHALLRRRRALAAEFLAPMPSEEDLQSELVTNVIDQGEVTDASRADQTIPTVSIDQLTSDHFEALVALAESRLGRQVLLAPCGANEGVNVVSIEGWQLRLIHCAARSGSRLDANVVTDVAAAFDGYRAQRLRSVPRSVQVSTILAVNGPLTQQAVDAARARRIDLLAAGELERHVSLHGCTAADLDVVLDSRLGGMRDLQLAIERAFGGADTSTPSSGAVPRQEEVWIDALVRSARYLTQCEINARTALPEERMRECLRALGERGGKLTLLAFAQRLGVTTVRATGIVAALRRTLNVDGYAVVAFDENALSVELNRDLLGVQFELE